MDIQGAAALAACSCLENREGLETLRKLVVNIVDHPQDEKFRSVSLAALEKRGLTLECREFLQCVGFIEEHGRLCFRPAVGAELLEGVAAIEDILKQRAQDRARQEAPHIGLAVSSSPGVVVPSDDRAALRQARLAALDRGAGAVSLADVVAAPQLRADMPPQAPSLDRPGIEGIFVDMGFPLAKVQEVLTRVERADDVDAVLPELLAAMQESPSVSQPGLARATSAESATPDMPTLERAMSGQSCHILRAVFEQGTTSVKDAARTLLLISAALQQGLIAERQRQDLHEHILAGRLDFAGDVVASIGVRDTPEMILPRGVKPWQCSVCFDDQHVYGWRCPPQQHRFCNDCMLHHIDSVPFPRCPMCDYSLGITDFEMLKAPQARIEAFQEARLRGAVDTLARSDEISIRCSRPECSNVVVLPASSGRQRFECGVCGAPAFCTKCKQPYHYHVGCGRVQPLREQWLAWISGERDDYHGRARSAAESDKRNQALYEGIARHNELEADERWKAENCRLCPKCSRTISKVEGCDAMVCGRAYHGGDQQPGCGHEFNWATAKRYEVASIRRRELPSDVSSSRLRGRDVFHPFTDCCVCGAQGIKGLRFRCIHCEAFDVCGACEPRLGDLHEADHVFEILFESDFRCPWLPRDTRVRIVRFGNKAPKSMTRCSITDLEGLSGAVIGRRRPPIEAYQVELDLGQGTVELDPEFLEPVITSRAEAEQLLLRTLEEDGEEPAPVHAAPAVTAPRPALAPLEEDFADDSPLSDSGSDGPQRRRPVVRSQGRGGAGRAPTYTGGGGRLGGAGRHGQRGGAGRGQVALRRDRGEEAFVDFF